MVTNRIGIDSFSYHRYFGEVGPYEQPVNKTWTTSQFLAHAAETGVEIVSLQTTYISPEEQETLPLELGRVGLQAILAWGHPDGLRGGTDAARLNECLSLISYAHSIGCDLVRFVTGNQYSWVEPPQTRMERLFPMLQRLVHQAENLGIDLAWENHADFSVVDMVSAIEQIDSPRLGMCFDIANADRVGDDVLEVVQVASSHIRMLHCRDIIRPKDRHDPTAFWAAVPLGKGELPLAEIFPLLLERTGSLPYFVEFTNLHPGFHDEQAVVIESLSYLRKFVCA